MDVGKVVMGIIAGSLVVCTLLVLAFKGPDAMPFDWIGVIGAAVFTAAAVAFIRLAPEHPPHEH